MTSSLEYRAAYDDDADNVRAMTDHVTDPYGQAVTALDNEITGGTDPAPVVRREPDMWRPPEPDLPAGWTGLVAANSTRWHVLVQTWDGNAWVDPEPWAGYAANGRDEFVALDPVAAVNGQVMPVGRAWRTDTAGGD